MLKEHNAWEPTFWQGIWWEIVGVKIMVYIDFFVKETFLLLLYLFVAFISFCKITSVKWFSEDNRIAQVGEDKMLRYNM